MYSYGTVRYGVFYLHQCLMHVHRTVLRGEFQNQLPIGLLKKYKIENKPLLYGTVTYITALLLHMVAIHI
jgi:hypothetical protein